MGQARPRLFQLEAYLWHIWSRTGQEVAPEVSRTNRWWGWRFCCWVSARGSLCLLPAMQRQLWFPCTRWLTAFALWAPEHEHWCFAEIPWGLVQLWVLLYSLSSSHTLCSAKRSSLDPFQPCWQRPQHQLNILSFMVAAKKKVKAFKLCFANYAEGFRKWVFLACHKNKSGALYFYPFNLQN